MPTISLCMIVKNEENDLGKCLESVSSIVDEMIIVDTGSTDRTKEIAQSYSENVFDFEWIDDFSAARNFSFAQTTKDYILWLDADDILLDDDQEKLIDLKNSLDEEVDSITMIYNYAFDEFGNVTTSLRRNRLVKRSCHFQWVGPVHEYLDVKGNIINSDVTITHTRTHAHTGRNLAIFEKRSARGENFSPRDLYYFANELMDNKHYKKAAEIYEKFLAGKNGWREDVISACYKLSEAYCLLGNEEKELSSAFRSFDYDKPRAEICCRLGFFFIKRNQYEQAAFWYRLATDLKKPENHWGFIQNACWTWLPHLQLCVCYYHLKDWKASYYHNEKARNYRPTDPHVLHNKELLDNLRQVMMKQDEVSL